MDAIREIAALIILSVVCTTIATRAGISSVFQSKQPKDCVINIVYFVLGVLFALICPFGI